MVNNIIFGVLVFALVMCIVSAVTEIIPPKGKKTFNFFRFIRVKMRGISLTAVIFFSALVIIINLVSKNSPKNIVYVEIFMLFLCHLTVNGERIFSTLKSLKKLPKENILHTNKLNKKFSGNVSQVGFTPVLPLKHELKARE